MHIREYHPADLTELVSIYEAHGFDYPFPQLADPRFVSKLVLEAEGKIRVAAAARATVEIYLLLDPAAGTPEERWAQLGKLHRAMETDLFNKGLTDMHAWLPPDMVRPFGRRLVRDLGWVRDDRFTPFVKYLVPDPGPRVLAPEQGGK